jgi:hypothetical protein
MKNIIKISAVIILLSSALYAELNIYLMPRFDLDESAEKKSIKLTDISQVDGTPEDIASFKKIIIPAKIYADGYIDRSEVLDFVKSRYTGDVSVYGTSVKINRINPEGEKENELYEVKSGSIVSFIVINNGITVRSQGTAVESGKTGDIIQVKFKKSRTAKGKVVTDKIVELEL